MVRDATPRFILLREIGLKLKGVGYLFEMQGIRDFTAKDADEIHEGIGIILSELGQQVVEFAENLDGK